MSKGRNGIDWYGLVWIGKNWYGLVWIGMGWYGLVWVGMDWYGLVWIGMDWYGSVWDCVRKWYSAVWHYSRHFCICPPVLTSLPALCIVGLLPRLAVTVHLEGQVSLKYS